MDHNQLLQLILTFIMSGASAWGGAKYAIRYLEKTTDEHAKDINAIRCDIKKMVSQDSCKDSKLNCRADKTVSVKEIMDKIDRLSVDVIEQNRRREDAKDDNQRLYMEISNKLARLEARLEALIDSKD